MHDGISSDPEEVSPNIPESVKVYNGDVLFSWSASLEVMVWAYGLGGLNQHIFKVTSANGFPKSFYYFQLLNYVDVFKKMAEARKTTMGHITQDHLQQSTIAIPNDKDIAYKFEKRVSPILTETVKQQEVISILTKLRDSLLPLLMNGQVSVIMIYRTIESYFRSRFARIEPMCFCSSNTGRVTSKSSSISGLMRLWLPDVLLFYSAKVISQVVGC